MNWTAVVYGGPMMLVTIWWFAGARTWFKGPKVNVKHMMLGRDGSVVEGVRVGSPKGERSSFGSKAVEAVVDREGKGKGEGAGL